MGTLVAAIAACTSAPSENVARVSSAHADLELDEASATLTQTSARTWSLAKTGAVSSASQTVTWTITATQTTTTANQLVVAGCMDDLHNDGSTAATLGNVVVNLQTRVAHDWTTQSSDIANATVGDAATSAAIDARASSERRSSFATNAASGHVEFTSPCGGAAFSLAPETSIAAGAQTSLGFSATFDNNVLALPAGAPVRVELIVSYGNASEHGQSASNVDINGNGVIDADEAWVGGAKERIGFTVPAATVVTSSPTISDTAANITTTGTVTFSNAVFSIGSTSGTVTVSYNGGTGGGTIKNCATLSGQGISNVQACDTEMITRNCTPGAIGCGWQNGQVVTYDQGSWSAVTAASSLLSSDFASVYAPSGVVIVGSGGGFTMAFDSSSFILAYLPAGGTPGALTSNVLDPSTTSSGSFGGDVLALRLNIDFAAAGFLAGTANVELGNLTLCSLAAAPDLNGLTITQFIAIANTALGGGATTDSIATLDSIASSINAAFDGGIASVFAQQNIVNGVCQ